MVTEEATTEKKDKSRITATERRELRSMVRAQMKALRSDVEQRRASARTEIDKHLHDRFQTEEARLQDLRDLASAIAAEATQKLSEAIDAFEAVSVGGDWGYRGRDYLRFNAPSFSRNISGRSSLEQRLVRSVDSEVRKAKWDIDRKEADLLRELAIDSLKSDSALEFIANFPTVEELVPGQALREIESGGEESE